MLHAQTGVTDAELRQDEFARKNNREREKVNPLGFTVAWIWIRSGVHAVRGSSGPSPELSRSSPDLEAAGARRGRGGFWPRDRDRTI